jgi:pyridoxamine 5'-phosphate oxidase
MGALRDEIKKLREDFVKGTLNEKDAKEHPFELFELWLLEAVESQAPEVQATVLSTVSKDGKPSSRIVYLREFENNKFWIYGNYNSRKSRQMEINPNVCLNFFWPSLEKQIRIEGTVVKCEAKHSDDYFQNRPYESKLGAWASDQSAELNSRQELEDAVEKYRKQFEGKDIPRPPHWGGWILTANYYEFWQGRKSRLHDRITYALKKDKWIIKRLAP